MSDRLFGDPGDEAETEPATTDEVYGAGAELVRPAAPRAHRPAPAPQGVGHVLVHVQLPASVDVDIYAGKLKARALELDERAIVYTTRQPARAPRR